MKKKIVSREKKLIIIIKQTETCSKKREKILTNAKHK